MSIKEMAKDYEVVASIIMGEAKAGRANHLTVANIFMNGANAVLEEIERIMLLKYDEVSTYELIEDKIRELKGGKDD